MRVSFYMTILVISCMLVGLTAVSIVFLRANTIDKEQAGLQLLRQDMVQTNEALILVKQWRNTLDVFLANPTIGLDKNLQEQIKAVAYLNQQYSGNENIQKVSQRMHDISNRCKQVSLKPGAVISAQEVVEIRDLAQGLDVVVLSLQKALSLEIVNQEKSIDDLQKFFALTTYVCPVLFVIFTWVMLKWSNRTIVQPLKELTGQARNGEIKQSELSHKPPVEVMHLAESINEYVTALVEAKEQAWQEARQSEYTNARIVNIMETAADAIICTDCGGNIIQYNASFRRLIYLTDDFEGEMTCQSFLPNLCLDDYSHDVMETFVSVEQTFLNNVNGDSISIELSISHFSYEGVMYFTMVLRDIRERERMQQQIMQAQKMESVGTLAAGVAHEINTPTQYIRNYCSFLKESFEDLHKYLLVSQQLKEAQMTSIADEIDLDFLLEEIPQALDGSLEGLDRVAEIVKSMKVMSHPTKDAKVLYNINSLLKDATVLTKSQWKNVAEVKFLLDESIPETPCFPGLLSQTFINIIVNAAQAIQEQIKTQTFETVGLITIRTTMKNRNIVIKISDTGIGVKDKIRTKIFDPFFTTKEVGVGTGQGLALSHDFVVDKHGGSINFDSNPGLGCSFTIMIPFVTQNP
jgi:PAS domain S-box-containing protein